MNDSRNFEVTIHVCFLVLNVFGNSLVIYLYCVDRALRHKQANRFVISLAFCDLLVAVIYIPHQIFKTAIQKAVPVPISGYVTSISALGSLWNLAALTYDRYVAVFDCLRYEQVMRPRKVTKFMTAIWISDFFITLLPLSWKFLVSPATNDLLLHCYQFILVTIMIAVHVVLFAVYVRLFITNRHHLSFLRDRSQMFTVGKPEDRKLKRKSMLVPSCPRRINCSKRRKNKRSTTLSSNQAKISAKRDTVILQNISTVRSMSDLCNNWETNLCESIGISCAGEHLMPCTENAGRRESTRGSNVSNVRTAFRLKAGKALEKMSHSRAVSVELRAARVVLILFIFNTVCWIPTVTLNVVYLISWLRKSPAIPSMLFCISKYCFLSYSSINPWIYGILKGDFKKAMKKHIIRNNFMIKWRRWGGCWKST